ncbi:MAG: hypothetical protein JOZ79_13975 [Sphingomonas sp.]|nr:hypothetical protein [Sphingomonas sp.]
MIDRIGAVLRDHRKGLLGSDEDAADHILIALREATPSMCESGDDAIADGQAAIGVWRQMIDSIRALA